MHRTQVRILILLYCTYLITSSLPWPPIFDRIYMLRPHCSPAPFDLECRGYLHYFSNICLLPTMSGAGWHIFLHLPITTSHPEPSPYDLTRWPLVHSDKVVCSEGRVLDPVHQQLLYCLISMELWRCARAPSQAELPKRIQPDTG